MREENALKEFYPFGMLMPERSFSAIDEYRFGFNGKLRDDDIKGDGNSLDFGARLFDARLGRWMSVDPLFKKFSEWSPYTFVLDRPLMIQDIDGRDTFIMHRSAPVKELGDNETQIFIITFSIIKDRVEEVLPERMYMMSNPQYDNADDNGMNQKPAYKISFDNMPKATSKDGSTMYPNTIKLTELGCFVHPANYAQQLFGCYTISQDPPVKYGENPPLIALESTQTGLNHIRGLYDQANGGEKGTELTGDKFLLIPNSKAVNDIKPMPTLQPTELK